MSFAVRRGILALAVVLLPAVASAQPVSWSAFQARWPGRWLPVWTAPHHGLRFVGAPSVPESRADALVADVAALAGVDSAELVRARVASRVDRAGAVRELLRFDRYWHGVRVEGDQVLVAVVAGRIGALWVRLGPIRGLAEPYAGELVVRLPDGGAALARPIARHGRIEWTDRSGRVVLWVPTIFDATLTVTHEERGVGDPLVPHPARGVTLTTAGGDRAVTDDDGAVALDGPFEVALNGPRLTIVQDGRTVRVASVDDGDLLGGADLSLEAASVLYHYPLVHDWMVARGADTSGMDERTSTTVDDTDIPCNAYYDNFGDRFGFSPADGDCAAMARYGDVVLHEAGHRVHWKNMVGGTFAEDVSEGSADYLAATMDDDPRIAPGFGGGGRPLRAIDDDHVYPDDLWGEPHEDGLIWASFLWDVREALSAERGADEGVDVTDRLFLGAIEQGPTMTELWSAVLVADDDDGDLTNGTPNDCTLLDLLEEHGLGPVSLGLVTVAHAQPVAPGSDATSYPVAFAAGESFGRCASHATRRMTLRWTTVPDAPLPETGAPDPAWTTVELAPAEGGFAGTIPRVPANTVVRYLVEMEREDGLVITSHGGQREKLWSFWVGDRRPLWCDDFEGDVSAWSSDVGVPYAAGAPRNAVDDWTIGRPVGGGWDPTTAASGERIAGTYLSGDYLAQNSEHLLTPEVTFAGRGVMRLVTLARWLSVEDGLYDHAGIWGELADGEGWAPVWENPGTRAGDVAIVDGAWTHREHDLAPLLAADGSRTGALRLAFTLESDEGLEFGGWSIDDVCVVELAEPERHYRVHDLSASVEGSVVLRWTMPWIRPVTAVAVVRKKDEAPSGPDDGTRLPVAIEPTGAGTAVQVEDAEVATGTWHYAVFLAGAGGDTDWWGDVVPGENETSVTLGEEPPAGEDAGPDAGDDAGTGGSVGGGVTGGGCSCRAAVGTGAGTGTAGTVGLALLACALAFGRRRAARRAHRRPRSLA